MKGYEKEIVQETINLIKIPSVKSPKELGAPFGKGVKNALHYTLNLCKNLGMKTTNMNDYIGYAEYGSGEKEIGILVHIDVVPVEEKEWTYPPFQGVIEDDRIYGRGALDDKGPAIAAIYAVKKLIDENRDWNKKIKIIVCTDEESSWEGIEYYLQQGEHIPDFSIAPDANFPLIYAEKGILHLESIVNLKNNWPAEIVGGSRPNIVPDYCCVSLSNTIKEVMSAADHKDISVLEFKGVSAHASLPEKGENAIVKAFENLASVELCGKQENIFNDLYHYFKDIYGAGLNINFSDKESGRLTLNLGKIEKIENQLKLMIDIRYPVTYEGDQVIDTIREKIPNTHMIFEKKGLLKELVAPEIKILLEAYQEVMGREDAPISIGGGTLARAFPNSIAFGALFPGDEETAHQSNEYITINTLLKSHKIYYLALKKLLENDNW